MPHLDHDEVSPLHTFVEVASDLQDLVSIATGRTAEFRSVVLQHPEVPVRLLDGTARDHARQNLTYHAQWTNRVDHSAEGAGSDTPMSSLEMYFTFEHITAEGGRCWLDTAARFRTELGRVMATRYRPGYLEDRIMNVCVALESFDTHHRGTNDSVKYVTRIRECVALAGDQFRDLIVDDPDTWAKRVLDIRNDLGHHRDRFRLDGSVGGDLIAEQVPTG